MRFSFASLPPGDTFSHAGVSVIERDQQGLTLESHYNLYQIKEMAASFGITQIETIPVILEEIFLAYYGKGNGGNDA